MKITNNNNLSEITQLSLLKEVKTNGKLPPKWLDLKSLEFAPI